MSARPLIIAGREFTSRLFLGTGKFPSPGSMRDALAASGTQPETTYSNTSHDLVLETLNRRLSVDAIKSPAGQPLLVRTEPANLAARVKLSGAMPRMTLATFMKEIARANNLAVATDAKGMVVLVDKTPGSDLEFLGVSLN